MSPPKNGLDESRHQNDANYYESLREKYTRGNVHKREQVPHNSRGDRWSKDENNSPADHQHKKSEIDWGQQRNDGGSIKEPQNRAKNSNQKVKCIMGHFAGYRKRGQVVGRKYPDNKVSLSTNRIHGDSKVC